ncbi:MAG: ABC transporter substrate-binding protein [Pseudomonadota bacterium]
MRPTLVMALSFLASPTAALDCPEGQRPFVHAAGEDCIPTDPQRIVTLQDQNALMPLLELGVTPVASAGHLVDGRQVYRRMEDGMDTSDIAFVGSYREPDREAVAGQQPDLIVASPWPADLHELYLPIAPTVVIDMFNQPLEDALMQFAALVGRTDRAQDLRGALEAQAAEVRDLLGDRLETTTVSMIIYNPAEGNFYAISPVQSFGVIFRTLSMTRTAAEHVGVEREYRAMETLGNHAADVMLLVTFDANESVFSASFEDFMADPLVQALPVAPAGQVFAVDGGAMVGSAWSKPVHGLRHITDILLRDDLDRDLVME